MFVLFTGFFFWQLQITTAMALYPFTCRPVCAYVFMWTYALISLG
jgi:hypothetical protein